MRLLLIEDDAALRLTLARQLEADGYRVDQARDGEEGLFLAREYQVDKEFSQFQLELKRLWSGRGPQYWFRIVLRTLG